MKGKINYEYDTPYAPNLGPVKGQEHLDLDLRGESAGIYGNNSAGRTTVYDAVTWLLFGKDSHGQSSFDIKPLDGDGAVKDHTAISSVEAVFSSADGNITLKKTCYERWSTKRGGTEEVYDGNTSDYFVDGVPSKKYEYERRVSGLVSEDVFRLLTGVTYFCAEMDWRERRNVLFDVCGIATDLEMMEQDPQFLPLVDAVGHLSLEDYKKIQAERKGLTGIRDDLPARLDECRKTVEDLQGIDFAELRNEHEIESLKRSILRWIDEKSAADREIKRCNEEV